MERMISEILVEYGTNERLDKIAGKDKEYVQIREELDKAMQKKKALSLEMNEVEDRIASLDGEMMACYTRLAYEQGLKDAGEILKKCGLAPYDKGGQ